MSETDKSREAVQPCPFCASLATVEERFHIGCFHCGASGPDADEDDPSSRVAAWNRRDGALAWVADLKAQIVAARAAALAEAEAACQARIMGDNNREDMEARRCVEAIRAIARKEKA